MTVFSLSSNSWNESGWRTFFGTVARAIISGGSGERDEGLWHTVVVVLHTTERNRDQNRIWRPFPLDNDCPNNEEAARNVYSIEVLARK